MKLKSLLLLTLAVVQANAAPYTISNFMEREVYIQDSTERFIPIRGRRTVHDVELPSHFTFSLHKSGSNPRRVNIAEGTARVKFYIHNESTVKVRFTNSENEKLLDIKFALRYLNSKIDNADQEAREREEAAATRAREEVAKEDAAFLTQEALERASEEAARAKRDEAYRIAREEASLKAAEEAKSAAENREREEVARLQSSASTPAPVVEPVVPAAEPVVPVAEPIVPAAEPVVPVAEPIVPVVEPVVPAVEPVVPVVEPIVPAAEPVVPVAEPIVPVAEPIVPAAEPVVPVVEPVVPAAEPIVPVVEPVVPAAEPVVPAVEPIVPAAEPVAPAPAPAEIDPAAVVAAQIEVETRIAAFITTITAAMDPNLLRAQAIAHVAQDAAFLADAAVQQAMQDTINAHNATIEALDDADLAKIPARQALQAARTLVQAAANPVQASFWTGRTVAGLFATGVVLGSYAWEHWDKVSTLGGKLGKLFKKAEDTKTSSEKKKKAKKTAKKRSVIADDLESAE